MIFSSVTCLFTIFLNEQKEALKWERAEKLERAERQALNLETLKLESAKNAWVLSIILIYCL